MSDMVKASDCKCCECGAPAEVLWPVIDPDIEAHPYCKKCVAKEQFKLMQELHKIDEEHKKKTKKP